MGWVSGQGTIPNEVISGGKRDTDLARFFDDASVAGFVDEAQLVGA
jgi:hypothetical protein